jgi:hypothetical protein
MGIPKDGDGHTGNNYRQMLTTVFSIKSLLTEALLLYKKCWKRVKVSLILGAPPKISVASWVSLNF